MNKIFIEFLDRNLCECGSDDTVEVGASLFELDTEAVAAVGPASTLVSETSITPLSAPNSGASSAKSVESSPATSSSPQHRSPSIKFLGKDGWQAMKAGKEPDSVLVPAAQKGPLDVTVIRDDKPMHAMFGRPKFTDEEMEALIMGGASIAPNVVSHSKGAKFQY